MKLIQLKGGMDISFMPPLGLFVSVEAFSGCSMTAKPAVPLRRAGSTDAPN